MSRVVLPIALGAGLIYCSAKLIISVLNNRPPNEWRLVGIISKIEYFPGVSCKPILMDVIEGNNGTVHAPETPELKININELNKSNYPTKIILNGKKPDLEYRGDNVSAPLSDNILRESTGLLFEFCQGVFDDPNMGIEQFVAPLQHRPNALGEGPIAWYEDSWSWIKIGSDIVYKNVQPRIRYVYTTIDRATKPPKWTFRSFEKIHLGIPSNGKVKLGDGVYVA